MELPPPYEDHLTGACVRMNEKVILLAGEQWQSALTGREVLFTGALALRYGLPYLYEDDALIPQLVYDDHRREHTGHELFAFVAAHGHAYPRADAMGVRLSGQEDHVFLRDLDLALPLVVVARGRDSSESSPTTLQSAVLVEDGAPDWQAVTGAEAAPLPDLLITHLPCYRLPASRADELPLLLREQFAQRP